MEITPEQKLEILRYQQEVEKQENFLQRQRCSEIYDRAKAIQDELASMVSKQK